MKTKYQFFDVMYKLTILFKHFKCRDKKGYEFSWCSVLY